MLFPFVIFLIPCSFFLDTNTFCVSLRMPALSPKWSLTRSHRALGKHKGKPMGRTPHETMHFHRCWPGTELAVRVPGGTAMGLFLGIFSLSWAGPPSSSWSHCSFEMPRFRLVLHPALCPCCFYSWSTSGSRASRPLQGLAGPSSGCVGSRSLCHP